MPTPQNGPTHSNNSSTFANEFFECDDLMELVLKGLTHFLPMFPFDPLLETSNKKFSDFCRGNQKETFGRNEIKFLFLYRFVHYFVGIYDRILFLERLQLVVVIETSTLKQSFIF